MSTQEEKDLIKKRGSFKQRLTLFTNYLKTLNVSALTDVSISELQLRVSKLESLYDEYDEVQVKLECLAESVQSQVAERNEFETQYYKSISEAKTIIKRYEKKDVDLNRTENRSTTSNKLVKLPTIQLPKFSGSCNNWLEFRDTFMSLIHSNDVIDPINKFHYLRASLEGSAAEAIQDVEFSASNYDIAWRQLCERFDNKRLLIQHHVSALFNIEQITKESSEVLKRFLDQINKNLRILDSLGEPTQHWDTLLIHMLSKKLNQEIYHDWEKLKSENKDTKRVKLSTFLEFMRERAVLLETLELARQAPASSKSSPKLKTMVSVPSSSLVSSGVNSTDSPSMTCPKCNDDHSLSSCPQFLALSNNARLALLPSYKVCYNCLKGGHFANRCKKSGCKICKRRHNTLVHISFDGQTKKSISSYSDVGKPEPLGKMHQPLSTQPSVAVTAAPAPAPAAPPSNKASNTNLALSANVGPSEVGQHDVLLSTALIKLQDVDNRELIARAVLDSGSTSCLMTERMYERLRLPYDRVDKSVLGINNVSSHVGKMCRVSMSSLNDNFTTRLQCFILPSITNHVPCREIDLANLNIPTNICLADPNFHNPSDVDLILGADVFWDLLGSQKIKLGDGQPTLFETRLGWLVSGPINSDQMSRSRELKCNFVHLNNYDHNKVSDDDIQRQLTRFWQLEEVNSQSSHYFPEEKLCEDHFVKNTTRLDDGRFCVRIPLKDSPNVLGESYERAKQCFLSLERRLKNKPEFSKMYHDFMSEYQSLGHMTECVPVVTERKPYYIPHHGVLRESSTTTKLRVVFNASQATTSGVSLNNIQMVGPTVQDDLLSILLRFRQHKYILAADVEKMYRQIVVHPDDRYLTQIIWRDDASQPLKLFQLNTVTYGTASAPFLATRCLKQIGLDCADKKIAEIIMHDFYVDDLLTGGDDLSEVQAIRKDVTAALAAACMPLRKWKSNEPQLASEPFSSSLDLNIGHNEPSKLLGLGWHADSDELCFPIGKLTPKGNTKRDMLSAVSQIFDPTSLLSPCIIKLKMLLQKLWLEKLSWDEQLTPEISKRWADVINSLPVLNDLKIPRIIVCNDYKSVELHIFSDASECAYGACVYVRSMNENGEVLVRLLLAKSRVAPIKPTTIPRLELCGALAGARLYEKVVNSLRLPIKRVFFWTDSTIVLGWLKMLPSRLQTFVRNRAAEILEKTENCVWRHVPTDENPADLISRGVDANSLSTLNLWWSGPQYLQHDESKWPSPSRAVEKVLPETRPEVVLNVVQKDTSAESLIDCNRFSNYTRLIRTAAYVLRFVNACKKQRPVTEFLSEQELRQAKNLIISKCQDESFSEYELLKNNQNLPKKSPLLKFNVFLDKDGIMRVGGRLDNSNFPYEKKHPILVQSTNRFTKLLFDHEHKRLMHAGPQLLLASIRETFWPIGGRNLARACYHKCVLCARMKGKIVTPLMGNLPQQRLQPGGYPFESVGVDYAGPIMSASRQGRGCRLVKVYICIFVCFTVKAIHLELVGDLTSNNYLLALRRFMSRRGKPVNIFSDNGTSFVGACNEISDFLKRNCDSLSETLANEGISFHFIPAYSPHFGGLWEAGVKSTKYHLQRVMGHCNLTYEELNTTLVQIEAILNSRPLTPLSSNPEDLLPLTPGHFLIGRSFQSLPEKDYQDHSMNSLTRYQRIEQLRQHFWSRWSKEYVAELQQRTKWRSCKDALKLDSLVLVKEENLPPLKWKLGRVVAVHPGPDNIVRVADIKTSTGIIRRSFSKICPLPESSG